MATSTASRSTSCDDCGARVVLDVLGDEMDGGECNKCGYFTTRYTVAFKREAEGF